MATMRNYIVNFHPATRFQGGFQVEFDCTTRNVYHPVAANSLPSLEAQVRALAAAEGRTVSAYVRMAAAKDRKPNGFDAWAKTVQIIDFVAPVTRIEANTVYVLAFQGQFFTGGDAWSRDIADARQFSEAERGAFVKDHPGYGAWLTLDETGEVERFPIEDWRYEADNGDTKLGYVEWRAAKMECV